MTTNNYDKRGNLSNIATQHVPKLRFKGFSGEWEKHRLNDFLSIPQKEKAVIKSTNDLMTVKLNLGGLVSSSGKNLSLTATNYYVRHAGQFIYGKQNFFHGSMAIIPAEFEGKATSGDVPALDINNIDPNFLYYFLARPTYYKNKEAMALGTGSKRIHEKVLLTFDITVPNKLTEQQKIGTFFTKLDKLIELNERKLELLKKKKKGYLQAMLPQIEHTIPRLRFNNFTNNWAKNTLSSICKKIKAGGTPTSSNTEYYGEGYPFLSISDMSSNGKYIKKVSKSITYKGLNNSSAWILSKNNLLLSMYASVGKVAINEDDITFSQAIVGIIPKENISLEFLYQYMNYLQAINYYRFLISKGTQKNLNIQKIKNIVIITPKETEQKNISIFFNKLDQLIEFNEQKLNLLKDKKKAYLQKMFC